MDREVRLRLEQPEKESMRANHARLSWRQDVSEISFFDHERTVQMPLVLATVGSTRFDGLVSGVLASPCLRALSQRGYTDLVVQYGNSDWNYTSKEWDEYGIHIIAYTFKPSLSDDIKAASLVISHAGGLSRAETATYTYIF